MVLGVSRVPITALVRLRSKIMALLILSGPPYQEEITDGLEL
jgi:hypothetical protein